MSRTIIFGDVHGCLDEIDELTYAVRYVQGEDRLISLGDLMDRGPHPAKCVELARRYGAEIVQSNHDEKHLRYRKYLARKKADPKAKGDAPHLSEQDIRQNAMLSDEDVAWLDKAPDIIRIPEHNVFCVHAGFLPGTTPETCPHGVCIRCRWVTEDGQQAPSARDKEGRIVQPPGSYAWAARYHGAHHVVYGHAVWGLDEPRVDDVGGFLRWGIDTGACYGGHLTAMVLETGEKPRFVQVKSTGSYDEWYGP
jgi:hypothetical protein